MFTKNKCLFRFDSCLTLQKSFFFSFDIVVLLYRFRFFSLYFVFLLYLFRFISLDFVFLPYRFRFISLDFVFLLYRFRWILFSFRFVSQFTSTPIENQYQCSTCRYCISKTGKKNISHKNDVFYVIYVLFVVHECFI